MIYLQRMIDNRQHFNYKNSLCKIIVVIRILLIVISAMPRKEPLLVNQ